MCPILLVLLGLALIGILSPLARSTTVPPDVSALNVMYISLNSPSQLTGWTSSGGDPCGESWKGIKCSGSSVTEMLKLSGLGLTGSMGYQLSNLKSVTDFDMSKNNLKGDIPYQLPPNVDHLDLSQNGFTGGVPYSISQMTDLKYLDLGNNKLNGQLNDMFGQLHKLTLMDISFNTLSGNLPQSFGSLSSLTTLHLQNNHFAGSINVLSDLPLKDLNIENNKFTGWIPDALEDIDNLKAGGNSWSSGKAPPPPPGASSKEPRTIERSSKNGKGGGKSGLSGLAIAGIILGILLALAILIALFSKRSSPPPSHFYDEERLGNQKSFTPMVSQELSNDKHRTSYSDFKSSNSSNSTEAKALQKSLSGLKLPSSLDSLANRLSVRRSTSIHTAAYSLADLQSATNNFATASLLGEGSVGRVYKAKYADGKVFAVKKISSSFFQDDRKEDFSAVVSSVSKLRHPNIAEIVGYCSEQGHNMLIYEYFRNGSLHQFLHLSDDFSRPLTWNTRVKIALGAARAIEYLHEVCSPPMVHKNIKSSNILLDAELSPHLSDYGFAACHQRTSQNLGVGCNAPECTKPSAYTLKSDIYSFGVVMLEVMTGRMPYDSSRPRLEQSLVRWATPQLHEIDALEKMVDPALRGLYPSRSLSRFADIVALCVQTEPDFRPAMSEVVQGLARLTHGASHRMEDLGY